ncbi:MAG: ferrous iron transport protein A [Phycisphaerae bacterium]
MSTLAELSVGERARIRAHRSTADVRRRLMEMGLTPGVEVRLVRVAPLGDPLELALRGFRLSVRRGEADLVDVDPAAAPP